MVVNLRRVCMNRNSGVPGWLIRLSIPLLISESFVQACWVWNLLKKFKKKFKNEDSEETLVW